MSARPWLGLSGLLAGAALLGAALPGTWEHTLDWQPARAWPEAWRSLSPVMVHYSALHLGANLAGTALVAALGWAARLTLRSTLAWALAWPLTQLGLWLQPGLLHYGGLSGVLHAGVAVAAVHLAVARRSRQRAIGLALLAGLLVKLLAEAPWGDALRRPADWDIAIAPIAHASGTVAGLLSAALAEAWPQRRVGQE